MEPLEVFEVRAPVVTLQGCVTHPMQHCYVRKNSRKVQESWGMSIFILLGWLRKTTWIPQDNHRWFLLKFKTATLLIPPRSSMASARWFYGRIAGTRHSEGADGNHYRTNPEVRPRCGTTDSNCRRQLDGLDCLAVCHDIARDEIDLLDATRKQYCISEATHFRCLNEAHWRVQRQTFTAEQPFIHYSCISLTGGLRHLYIFIYSQHAFPENAALATVSKSY